MAATIPTMIPTEIRAGDDIAFTRSWPDYLPATWTLTFHVVRDDGSASYSFEASDNGDGTHLVTISAVNSTKLKAGTWGFVERVDDGGDPATYATLNSGSLKVVRDLSLSADLRSHAKKVLDAIEATIEGRASSDQQAMAIGGRQMSRIPMPELVEIRDKYKAEVARELAAERIAAGLSGKGRVEVRFP